MSDPNAAPIVAPASPLNDQLTAGLRQLILVAAAVATALGYTKAAGEISTFLMVVGPRAGLLTVIVGQITTRRSSQKLAVAAAAAPDNVAVVR